MLELDRQEGREDPQALGPPWWEFFNFQLEHKLVDEADSSIIGAVFKSKPPSNGPPFVVAFRGNLINVGSVFEDLKSDLQFILQKLPSTSRFQTAMKAVQETVQTAGNDRVWLAGHSLGSSIALLAGKNMARAGSFLESFLFNPPHLFAPIAMADENLKKIFRILSNIFTALLAFWKRSSPQLDQSADSFAALSHWVPQLFVNAADRLCSEYICDFEYRKEMQKDGAENITRIASQHSVVSLLTNENGEQVEPLHLVPSANLTINSNPPCDFMTAHGIRQWWKHDLSVQSNVYMYN